MTFIDASAPIAAHAAVATNVHGVGAGNDVASDNDISNHATDTSTHGVAQVANHAAIASQINTHAAVATNVHGTGAGNDIASDADITTHAAVATNVHGTGAGNDVASDADITTHAAIKQNVHGVGANDIADVADISTHSGLSQNVHGVGANDVQGANDLSTHASDTSTHGVAQVANHAAIASQIGTHAALTASHGVAHIAGRSSGDYTGDGNDNRAIPHGLTNAPKTVLFYYEDALAGFLLNGTLWSQFAGGGASFTTSTAADATNFYVISTVNTNTKLYHWVAIE